ncbi:DUF6117 family protein [Sphingopyxis alaskensis]|jgi:hypothetical protein|uniref:DUF6117 family protein n=1 Tax=Sphingopyxis alaskensis TaxID=117207 RepID=UPI00198AE6F1|nr:DUF6117 family protein [Sphingopyxis alaskensis]MBD3744823.1 hypothetical protein [Sphingopyxis terrae]MCM3418773.1 DUF6117 family protein [Sphingopyxis alaskensis]
MAVPIPDARTRAFLALLRAAEQGRLALMQCTDARTGEPCHVICAETTCPNVMKPFGHLQEGNAVDAYVPPPGWAFGAI